MNEPVLDRDEAVLILGILADTRENTRRLVELVEGDDGEEEETED